MPAGNAAPRIRHPIIRFLAINLTIGVLLGQALLVALFAVDAAGLRSLVFASAEPWLPIFILSAMFAITFGPAYTTTALLLAPRPSDHESR